MLGDNVEDEDESDERYSNVHVLGDSRQSLLPFDKKGHVSLADIRAKLTAARSIRMRRTEAALLQQQLMRQTTTAMNNNNGLSSSSVTSEQRNNNKNNVENPMFRATIAESSDLELSKVKKALSKRYSKDV